MIERIHLNILREIERQGSLTAAADALNLTQSALSHAIRKLEGQFETELWVKEGRKLRLTEAGQYLQDQANRLLPQLERVDENLRQFAKNEKGTLHIGMECHPCYQWLLNIVNPFLHTSPGVDVDVKQRFKFGGMAALFNYDIDLLITPDPLLIPQVMFEPVFDYELVLVVGEQHALREKSCAMPKDLSEEVLFTYPVETARLDIFQQFLIPAHYMPKQHKQLEDTEIILQMVAAHRGVTAMPKWLIDKYQEKLPIYPVRLGTGIFKHIYVGYRQSDQNNAHIQKFIQLAKDPEIVEH